MFRITRYIILFLIIMLCLFWLNKNNVDVATGFDKFIVNSKSFFKSIASSPKGSPDKIYNDINSQDFMGGLATSTQKATTVKAYVEDNTVDKPKVNAKISIDGIIHYTNIERKKAGLQPLTKSSKLSDSSSKKIDDMFSGQYFEHVSPDGDTAADLVRSVGYKFQIVGENLALGIFDTDKTLVQAWMNSPTHKANILNPKYTEMGAAVGISDYKKQKQWMAVQHFAKPLPMCDAIDEVIQKNIDTEKIALELEERELQKMAGVIESDAEKSVDRAYLDSYNEKVALYNVRLNNLRVIIDNFNKTIVEYNSCLKGL